MESLFSTPFLAHFSLFSFLILFLLMKLTTPNAAAGSNFSSPYHPTDIIALSCGSPSPTPSLPKDLPWTSDTTSQFGPFPSSTTTTSTASTQDTSIPIVPYITARLSTSPFNYTFPVSHGMKFIRLHFYPSSYLGYDNISNSFFSVTLNDHFTLLHNFSAYLTSLSLINTPKLVIKEFCVNLDTQNLTLSFTPTRSSFAFINGIEIVSMPNTLYIQGFDVYLPVIGIPDILYPIDYTTTLETIHRLNVGGNTISAGADTGMFREWINDDDFVNKDGFTPSMPDTKIQYTQAIPAYIAPEDVYRTARTMGNDTIVNQNYNLTWSFTVDSGFNYLVRLHFCEFQKEITKLNERVFDIFINNQTAEVGADIIAFSGGNGIPVYRDYLVMNDQGGSTGRYDLSVSLHPNPDSGSLYSDAILNGLELFKLSHNDGNLNPETTQGHIPCTLVHLRIYPINTY